MDSEDWKTLEHRAIWLLGHADQAPPREHFQGMALQLRLWRYKRSGMHVSWSVIVPVRDYHDRKAIVREASWDRPRERKRRKAVDPAVCFRDAEVDWKDLSPFLDRAGGLRPSVAGRGAELSAGRDAAGLEGSRSFAHVQLEWSGRGPRGWAETISWFERFRKLLVRALPKP